MPDFLLLYDLLSVGWSVLGALVVSRFGLFNVVDLIPVIVCAAVHGLMFFITLGNGSIGHYIKPRLCLGD